MTGNKSFTINTAVILAGGQGKRIGQDKSGVLLSGKELIFHVISALEQHFNKIILISNSVSAISKYPQYSDVIKGKGPLGGIHAGLSVIDSSHAFFVACDMPFLNPLVIEKILCCHKNEDALVPLIDNKLQPLHGIYGSNCTPVIGEILSGRRYNIKFMLNRVACTYLKNSCFKGIENYKMSFFNINTADDLAQAELICADQMEMS